MIDARRALLKTLVQSAALYGAAHLIPTIVRAAETPLGFANLPEGALDSQVLDALPGKLPLIKKSFRPPNFETPVEYFKDVITPNNAFFVRYHLSSIPQVDAKAWRLKIGGESVEAPFELTLDSLKRDFEQVELVAVCQCSGNRRGLFEPHVAGVIWGPGAMGNAGWKGVRLRDVLNRAKLKKGALEIVLNGADGPVLPATPDFVKSLPVWKAMDENTIVAYEMNGEPIPHWNGFPARLIVPGWTATYWTKHIVSLDAIAKPFDGFWMKSAYRIPLGKFPQIERFTSQDSEVNTPITDMVVNSLITSITRGSKAAAGKPFEVAGIAWDGGYGMATVEVSTDGGNTWRRAQLGKDHGRYSFRPWALTFTPDRAGTLQVMAKATNRNGEAQTFSLIANPAGYQHNVVQTVPLQVI
jgi:DMSO/TMAO reductase YedYZ molybdopterin-dependent catalytic subunit